MELSGGPTKDEVMAISLFKLGLWLVLKRLVCTSVYVQFLLHVKNLQGLLAFCRLQFHLY